MIHENFSSQWWASATYTNYSTCIHCMTVGWGQILESSEFKWRKTLCETWVRMVTATWTCSTCRTGTALPPNFCAMRNTDRNLKKYFSTCVHAMHFQRYTLWFSFWGETCLKFVPKIDLKILIRLQRNSELSI